MKLFYNHSELPARLTPDVMFHPRTDTEGGGEAAAPKLPYDNVH